MRKGISFFVVLAFLGGGLPASCEEKLRVGVVEFEERNSIGVENAGQIVAEWMVTEIARIGTFEVEERLLLEKVLEEQELSLSEAFDQSTAVRIGELYGVQGIVTGTVMKFGSKISITGRIIDAANGEVLKTASVSTEDLGMVESEVTILANQLCDISRDQFEIQQDLYMRSQARIALGAGLGLMGTITGETGFGVQTTVLFTSKWADLWFHAIPLGSAQHIEFGGVINALNFLGIGAAYGIVFDNVLDFFELHYIHFGVIARPRLNIDMGVFIGGALTGTVWTDDSGPIEDLDSYWKFPTNYGVFASYYFSDNLGLMVKYLGAEIGDLKDVIPENYYFPSVDWEYRYGQLTVAVLYRFAI